MSAIAGIYGYYPDDLPVAEYGGTLMTGLEKYPADDVRTWNSGRVFLGCRAQHITPESVRERLPYYDSERQLAITSDAIIDNRADLFRLLQIESGRGQAMSDSELILLAYDRWGTEATNYLVGDFAFMIWDERRQRLYGARDMSGGRTLYFARNRQWLAFCTVIQPLLLLPQMKKELNEQWLAQYLAISTVVDAVDASITPYRQIEQIPPAHSITIDRDRVVLARYGSLTSVKPLKLKSNEDYVEAFRDVFQTAVKARLRTHRKVGAHLSGGLDSGSVVGFAAKALIEENKPLHTFSYIPQHDFIDYTPKYLMPDERPYIQSTVRHVGGIQDHYLDFAGDNAFSEIDDMLDMLETPYKFFENSFWLKGMFAKAHEEGIGVLLSGARGNLSISWGSALDHYAKLLKKLRWVRLVQELHHYSMNVGGPRLGRLPLVARVAFPALDRLFAAGERYTIPMLINPEFAKRTDVFAKLRDYGIDESGWFASTNVAEMRYRHYHDVFHWNATSTLTAKLSLRYSLWQRDPTNDIRVIRFCLSLPEEQFVQKGYDRALIRRSTAAILPDQVRLNQHVRGVQGADWLHRMLPYWDHVVAELRQLSQDDRLMQFLDGGAVRAALAKAESGARTEDATDPDYRIAMRSLIVHRYLKRFA